MSTSVGTATKQTKKPAARGRKSSARQEAEVPLVEQLLAAHDEAEAEREKQRAATERRIKQELAAIDLEEFRERLFTKARRPNPVTQRVTGCKSWEFELHDITWQAHYLDECQSVVEAWVEQNLGSGFEVIIRPKGNLQGRLCIKWKNLKPAGNTRH